MKVYYATTVNGEQILVTSEAETGVEFYVEDNTEVGGEFPVEIGDSDFAEISEADYAMLEELLETPLSEAFIEKALKHFDLEDALKREKKVFLESLLAILEELALDRLELSK